MEKEDVIEEFSAIKGIDRETALKLYNAGIKSISELRAQDAQELSEKIGFPPKTIEKWKNSAIDMMEDKKLEKSEETILTLKDFLNCSYEVAKSLRDVGIFSIEDLAKEDPVHLADDADIRLKYVRIWIKKAKKSIRSKK